MAIRPLARVLAVVVASLAGLLASENVAAQNARAIDARAKAAIDHWTAERRAAAIPRDLVIDSRGLGYLRLSGNGLEPYGHNIPAQAGDNRAQAPTAGPPGGSGDKTPPSISNMNPVAGATVGGTQTFSATVTDASGIKSVSVKIQKGSGVVQSFSASRSTGDVWGVSLQGLTDGTWTWWMVAKDGAKGGGNSTDSGHVTFTVDTSGGGGGGEPGEEPNAEWVDGGVDGGVVQSAAGRIYFEMPSNARRTRWAGYVCSGTVATDGTAGKSVIITAAHCVYDDANKAFARNVLFIPNQDATTGTGTDLNCDNDPMGCWAPSVGVVDVNWTTRTFPDNVAWDYAFYVVSDMGAHEGTVASDSLESAAGSMSVSFASPSLSLTHALGYSYDVDPQFMYCADAMTSLDSANWWLGNCGLSGGSSGGPWVQPMDTSTGNGPVTSVNSWGYTNQAGMAGPKLSDTSASCVFAMAKGAALNVTYADGDAGVKFSGTCP